MTYRGNLITIPKSLVISILVFFISLQEISATYSPINFDHITAENGLSHNMVSAIYQDSYGFMWFGTYFELTRFDGYNFKVFKPINNDPTSIGHRIISYITEDKNGNLWIGTDGGGISVYNHQSEKFTRIQRRDSVLNSLPSNRISYIYPQNDSIIWIGTYGEGLCKYNIKTQVFKVFQHQPNNNKSIVNNRVVQILERANGDFWIATYNGLSLFNEQTEEFKNYLYSPEMENGLSSNTINSLLEYPTGTLWIGTDDSGLNKLDVEKNSFKHFLHNPDNAKSISDNTIKSIYKDKQDNIWIGTYNGGLCLLDVNTEQFTSFKNDPFNDNSISSNSVWAIYQDDADIMWFATWGKGVDKYDKQKNKFITYRNNPKNSNSLSHNNVMSILEDSEGLIWIGTRGEGLNLLNKKTNQFTHYKHDPNNLNSISNNTIFSIYEDSQGYIWIGTDYGVNKFNKTKKTFERYTQNPDKPNDSNYIKGNAFFTILEENDSIMWFGGWDTGLNKYNRNTKSFTHYVHNPNDTSSISDNVIWKIYIDSKHVFWVGTRNGLNIFNHNKNNFSRFIHNPQKTTSIAGNDAGCIYEDHNNNIWISTFGAGINLYNRSNNTFTNYSTTDGLINNVIYGILEDDSNNLWLSSNFGISRFNITSKEIKNFDESDGLQGNEFNLGSYSKGKISGNFYYGGVSGFSFFNPNEVKENKYKPKVVLLNLQVMSKNVGIGDTVKGKVILNQSISNTKKVRLNHKHDIFTIEFSSLHYSSPKKNKYAYKLEGFNNTWTHTDANRRYATYTNLDPGEYVFKVKGTNSNGVWNETVTELIIKIIPPFWKTWWFRISVLLFISMLAIFFHRKRVINIKNQKLELELLVKQRTNEVREQNNKLTYANEELLSKSEEIKQQAEELSTQNEELQSTIEELKRVQNQLVQSEKMASLGVLSAGIAHEINNPINFVFAGINSLARDFKDIEPILTEINKLTPKDADLSDKIIHIEQLKQDNYFDEALKAIPETIDDIRIGADRTAEIVKGLRNFSRTDPGNQGLLDIHYSLNTALLLLKNKHKNHIEIIKDYDTKIESVKCFPGKISQVLLNILSNAIDSIEEKGEIKIKTQQDGEKVIISIKDNGHGMDNDTKNKIFDPFFTTKDVGKGTGLGLSISYGIIKDHNGKIEVISEQNTGTEFIITLPYNSRY